MVPFDENTYIEYMNHEVRDWLETTVQSGNITSADGVNLHYYYGIQENAKAAIVIVHGFCEFFGKYHEVACNMYQEGYNFFFMEQRGHGQSGRTVSKDYLVHVDDFGEYVADLKLFLDQIVLPMTGNERLILFCHSMGGAVGTLFLEQYRDYFQAAVLSSPMLKMKYGELKDWQVRALSRTASTFRWEHRALPGVEPFDPERPDFENSSAASRARYDYQFRLRAEGGTAYTMNGGTYGWAQAGMRATEELLHKIGIIQIPVLILQAGQDDMVDNHGQDVALRKLRHAELRRFPESKHEIYNAEGETLRKYYRVLFRFLEKQSER